MSKHGWTYKKLGEVCVSDLGKTLNQSKDTGNLRPYLCAVNIQWDRIDMSLLKETRFEDSELERYSIVKGDLLVCEGGDVGRAAIWYDDNPIQYQNALHRIRFDDQMTARFCLYFLYNLKLTGELDSKYSKGVTIKHLVKSSLLSIPIPVPSVVEQEAIVTELDEINEAIAEMQQQVADLDTLAQSTFYDMFGDPVTNPKAWPVKPMESVGEIIAGSTPSTTDETNWDGDINWVTPAELGEQLYYGETVRKITAKAAARLTLMPIGTVLLSSRAPIGKLAISTVPMCCNQGFKNIVCHDNMNNIFLFFYLKLTMDKIVALGRGATFKEISKKEISNYGVLFPPLALQQEFAEKVEAIEAAKAELNAQIAEMQTLLASRMDFYFA